MVLPRLDEEGTIIGFNVRNTNEVPIVTADLRAAYLLVQPDSACSNMPDNAGNLFCARDNEYSANVCTHSIGSPFVTSFRGNLILVKALLSPKFRKFDFFLIFRFRLACYLNLSCFAFDLIVRGMFRRRTM